MKPRIWREGGIWKLYAPSSHLIMGRWPACHTGEGTRDECFAFLKQLYREGKVKSSA